MIKLNFNKPAKNLDGSNLKDHLGKEIDKSFAAILSDHLSNTDKIEGIEILKAFDWAMTLSKKEPLQLDSVDCDKLEKFIEKSQMPIVVKAPMLHVIRDSKEEEKKSAKK